MVVDFFDFGFKRPGANETPLFEGYFHGDFVVMVLVAVSDAWGEYGTDTDALVATGLLEVSMAEVSLGNDKFKPPGLGVRDDEGDGPVDSVLRSTG